ncbi:MAG: NUDIX domain-containing protein [Clostridiaceae bacterium]|nr:NUDIX domain-containing protein [Clostridiaceae bacterium]
MARQPKQVHIFLFRQKGNEYEYAIFQRADMPFCWQGICGGLEDSETIEEGARRETFEEAGIKEILPLYQLESISYLPDNIFSDTTRLIWGRGVVVVPMYFFAMPFDGQINLSDEHTDIKWLSYEEAYNFIYYKDQQIALYELNEKLLRSNLFE